MTIDLPKNSQGQRIDSWKEIAAFFGRDERTVKRWESQRGLPVHRVPGGGRGTVYAFTEELTAWLRSSQQRESHETTVLSTPGGNATVPSSLTEIPQVPDVSQPAVLPVALPGNPKPWWILGAALAVIAVALLAFPRFFQLRSVQGRVMPSIARRTAVAPRKEAEDLYLQGRYYWNKRTPDSLTLALDDFTKASQLDPNYALAYRCV